ncbi:unnamed protein product [Microthlaspi erraticum]|uniref:Uncharacterized protein n=1 Tax=Microthlaspi erraticum TaxID=1685480 RepID=A0A6D2IEM2_9BRAS|nr:unnamed protein product [Microthlaspi erraticum]
MQIDRILLMIRVIYYGFKDGSLGDGDGVIGNLGIFFGLDLCGGLRHSLSAKTRGYGGGFDRSDGSGVGSIEIEKSVRSHLLLMRNGERRKKDTDPFDSNHLDGESYLGNRICLMCIEDLGRIALGRKKWSVGNKGKWG